jgi:hypothetical protein
VRIKIDSLLGGSGTKGLNMSQVKGLGHGFGGKLSSSIQALRTSNRIPQIGVNKESRLRVGTGDY